jgi:ribosomal protein L19
MWKEYRRKAHSEMRPFVEGETLKSSVSISEADRNNGSPKVGDMIARNPKNHEDQWLVAQKYFEENLEEIS